MNEPHLGKPAKASKVEPNPYLDARRHWNERYGHALSSAKNWRLIAFVESIIILILVAGFIYLSSRSTLVPYVMQVDNSGNTIAVMRPDPIEIDEGLIKTVLAQFIIDMRGVTPDTTEQKNRLTRVYSKIANGSPAKIKMDEFYNEVDYFETAKEFIVTTDIDSVLRTNDNQFSVEWFEKKRKRTGEMVGTERKKASITYELGDIPKKERLLINNPIGLYVTTFNISEIYN